MTTDANLALLEQIETRLAKRKQALAELPKTGGLFAALFGSGTQRKRGILEREVRSLGRELEGLLLPPDDLPTGDALLEALEDLATQLQGIELPVGVDDEGVVEVLWEPAHALFTLARSLGDPDLRVSVEGLRRRCWIVAADSFGGLRRDLQALAQMARTHAENLVRIEAAGAQGDKGFEQRVAELHEELHTLLRNPPMSTTRMERTKIRHAAPSLLFTASDPRLPHLLRGVTGRLHALAVEVEDPAAVERADSLRSRARAVQALGWNQLLQEMLQVLAALAESPRGIQLREAGGGDRRWEEVRAKLQQAREALGQLQAGSEGAAATAGLRLRETTVLLAKLGGGAEVPGALEVMQFGAAVNSSARLDPTTISAEGLALVERLEQLVDALAPVAAEQPPRGSGSTIASIAEER